jgi:hypothetical protein
MMRSLPVVGVAMRRVLAVASLGALAIAAGGAASTSGGEAESIVGSVQSVSGDTLVLKNRQNQVNELAIDDRTRFVEAGREIARDQIKPGDEVRAAFRVKHGMPVATEVWAAENPIQEGPVKGQTIGGK